jgi:glycerophosphoryl diester phosphodiesterase
MAATMMNVFFTREWRRSTRAAAIASLGAFVMSLSPLHSAAQRVEIIAHRGASHDAPENTIAAVHEAWKQSSDTLEIDIHLTGDNRLLVIHDATTRRTTGVDLKVSETPLEKLRELDAGLWKGQQWKGEKLPVLEEILPLVPDGKRIFIEIKSGLETLPEFKRVIANSPLKPEQMVVIGFSYETMAAVKRDLPALEVYWLSSFQKDKESGQFRPAISELIRKAKQAGFEGLNLSYRGPLNAKTISEIKAAGLKAYVWTVNDADVARAMAEGGIDGITTDRPAWIREQLKH